MSDPVLAKACAAALRAHAQTYAAVLPVSVCLRLELSADVLDEVQQEQEQEQPEPCGNFGSMTTDARGCSRPKGHSGDCRPFHTADPAEWADEPGYEAERLQQEKERPRFRRPSGETEMPPSEPGPTPEEQRRLLFAHFMADDLNAVHTLLTALGAPLTKTVPHRAYFDRTRQVMLSASERLKALRLAQPETSRQT